MKWPHLTHAFSSVSSRWLSLFQLLSSITSLIALLVLSRLLSRFTTRSTPQTKSLTHNLPIATQTVCSQAPSSLSRSLHPFDEPLDDWDPSDPGDPWSIYLAQPEVIHFCRLHLDFCLLLDPSRHDHK